MGAVVIKTIRNGGGGGSWNRYNSDERLAIGLRKFPFEKQPGQSQPLDVLNSNVCQK